MNVNVTEKGKLELDLREIIQIAAQQNSDDVIESIATTDDIVERVVDQLISGYTESVSSCGDRCLREQRERLIGSIAEFATMREHDLESVKRAAHSDGYIDGVYAALRFVFGDQSYEWPTVAENARRTLIDNLINGKA